MRSTNRYIALLGIAVLAAGCDTSEAKPSAGVPTATQQQKAAQVTDAVRAAFIKDMQDQLANVNRALQELSDKVERSNSAAKADAKAKLVALRDKAVQLNGELDKARNARDAVWSQVQADFKKSNDELKASVAQARTWLSEKIAP